jgi:hypothetical protein
MKQPAHYGMEREKQIRNIAARLGVADFVYTARPIRKGNATREVSGDGLLVVRDHGAVLQVKARDPSKATSDSQTRATSWVRKNSAKALSQGRGTKRELARLQCVGSPLMLSPVRAASLPEDLRGKYDFDLKVKPDNWPIIVVLDHPGCTGIDLGFQPDVLWLTFDDWHELHRRLRSTAALLVYVQRTLRAGLHVPLGHEDNRYGTLSAADEASASDAPGSLAFLAPLEGHDELGANLFHDVINKVWPDDGPIPWRSADEYRAIVEFLDSIPPRVQAIVGRWFLKKRADLAKGQSRATGLVRLDNQDRLVYGCSALTNWPSADEWTAEFSALTSLRHTQALESGAPRDTVTLGVGALVEAREGIHGVSYFFLMLKGHEGELPLPPDLRMNFEWRYGRHNHADGTTSELKVGGNDPCPCLSGKKFKKCCGERKQRLPSDSVIRTIREWDG